MGKYIIKEDGDREAFDEQKIKESLLRAGAKEKTINDIVGIINKHLENVSESKHIYKLVLKQLKKREPGAAVKYTLKKAIMDMGPAGYVFERYMARILNEYGYRTQTGEIIKGFCVDHEVDVIAHKDNNHYMIECKYHNNKGAKSAIQTVLYVYARFLDLKKANLDDREDYNFKEVWLATNTKCTTEAIKYANCVKMGIIAWHYPEDKNLEYYIENKKLYPISILPGLKNNHKIKLFENDILTVKDLMDNSPKSIEKLLSINKSASERLFARAAMLILND